MWGDSVVDINPWFERGAQSASTNLAGIEALGNASNSLGGAHATKGFRGVIHVI